MHPYSTVVCDSTAQGLLTLEVYRVEVAVRVSFRLPLRGWFMFVTHVLPFVFDNPYSAVNNRVLPRAAGMSSLRPRQDAITARRFAIPPGKTTSLRDFFASDFLRRELSDFFASVSTRSGRSRPDPSLPTMPSEAS
jgi:hypothetical protein